MITLSVEDMLAMAGLVASVIGMLTRRYWPTQKRIGWRAQLNLPIRMIPKEAEGRVELTLRHLGADVPDASIALLRVENAGVSQISEDDLHDPLRFVFEDRSILTAEVIDASDPTITRLLREGGLTVHGDTVTLPKVPLNRKDHFKVLVLLTGGGTAVGLQGFINGGRLVEGHWRRRAQMATSTLVVLLTASVTLLAASFVLGNGGGAPAHCAEGELTVNGSTAFEPLLTEIRDAYAEDCPDADITIEADGSLEGIRALTEARDRGDGSEDALIAASDGPSPNLPEGLVAHDVGIMIFSVVLNENLRVWDLTQDELRGIYTGEITNWSQIDERLDEPVRVVGRDGDSGTRVTFEGKVLHPEREQVFSSHDCERPRSGFAGEGYIRCEREGTEELLTEVDRLPGAIGYAELSAVGDYDNVVVAHINGNEPSVARIVQEGEDAYPFWAVETLYTAGRPEPGSLAEAFIAYMSGDEAEAILLTEGHAPCAPR
ncbi:PstS family phosphate ABC transporter substrate-binding protein, partial [Streptomyces sp. SBT349]|uniref:PstS family phosphate ABC transporter substrate-binding protein n=1 Tax=Streptomyces sp. SBT349 TaxID=1580539 RepID=UPI00066D5885